jgi:hypothetical protein
MDIINLIWSILGIIITAGWYIICFQAANWEKKNETGKFSFELAFAGPTICLLLCIFLAVGISGPCGLDYEYCEIYEYSVNKPFLPSFGKAALLESFLGLVILGWWES